MKKYFISVLIPYLLLQFSGCYSMQEVTKDEFFLTSGHPDIIVITNDEKEILFDEDDYIIQRDTIHGTGELKLINGRKTTYEEFKGSISINDVKEVRIDKFDIASTIGLVAVILIISAAIHVASMSAFEEIGKGLDSM